MKARSWPVSYTHLDVYKRQEETINTFERARHGVQPAARLTAARQGHVERLLGQPGFQGQAPNRLPAAIERRLDRFLGAIDRRADGLSLVWRKFGQALEQGCDLAALAEEGGLDLLKRCLLYTSRCV